MLKKWLLISLPFLLAGVILWSLLPPGYILTLDMTFVPHIPVPTVTADGFANSLPIRWVMYAFGLLMPGWVVQKILLLALFTLLPYLAYRFLLPSTTTRYARMWAALFYAINPFVYTRFLAGHWMHLFAYALLPLVWHVAKQRRPIVLATVLALTFAFSLHIGVMTILIVVLSLIGRGNPAPTYKRIGIAILTFLILTSYWTIPYLTHRNGAVLQEFNENHLEAFQTVAHAPFNTIGSVLSLYGFWGETQFWAEQFIWPQQYPWIFGISGIILALLIIFGIFKTNKKDLSVLLPICFFAFIFSCGVGETIFKPLNEWIFTHIPLWRGFRDSQKWSALLAFGYAYFGGIGLSRFLKPSPYEGEGGASRVRFFAAGGGSLIAVLLFTWPMLLGFSSQLHPVQYPSSWTTANEILKKDKNCKAIFLPWHSYLSFDFSNDILISNPARSFFNCEIITSKRVDLGNILYQGLFDQTYYTIEGIVTGIDHWNTEELLNIFHDLGITHVIFSHQLSEKNDDWSYDFLNNADVFTPHDFGKQNELTLYEVQR